MIERLPDESKRAYAAFEQYCQMGAGRSIDKLLAYFIQQRSMDPSWQPPSLKRNTLGKWSNTHEWVKRVEIYDQMIRAQRESLDLKLWEDRRSLILEQDYAIAQQLRTLAQSIIAEAPNFTKSKRQFVKGENGEPDREIITIGLNTPVMLKALELASKLARLATGLPADYIQQKLIGDKDQPIGHTLNLGEMTDEQLTNLLRDLKE